LNKHKEILEQLEKIPTLHKEFVKLESGIKGASAEKKSMTKEAYLKKLFDFMKTQLKNDIKKKIMLVGTKLHSSQPDFLPAYNNIEELNRYISAVGTAETNIRVKEQLELLKILEFRNGFKTVNDFIDDTKIKTLNTYLKGKK